MKTRLLLTLACVLAALTAPAQQPTTAFTYQGRLLDAGVPANGYYDFQFTLHDAPTGGNALGSPVINERVFVTNGLFTTEIDFGVGRFNGTTRWLGMGAHITESTTGFFTLPMRQALNSVPQSQFALVAGSVASGGITAGMIANNAVTTAALADGAVTAAKLDPPLAAAVSGPVPDNRLPAYLARLDRLANFTAGLTAIGDNVDLRLYDSTGDGPGVYGFMGQKDGVLHLGVAGREPGAPPFQASLYPFQRSHLALTTNGAVSTLVHNYSDNSATLIPRVTLDDGAGNMTLALGNLTLNSGGVSLAGDGNVTLLNGKVTMGDTFGQKLTLAGANFGVGAQANTLYSRSPGGFAWYRGGVHNDAEGNSGGVAALMTLNQNGDLSVPGNILMKNIVGLNYRQNGLPLQAFEFLESDGEITVDEVTLSAPGAGFIFISGRAEFSSDEGLSPLVVFRLYDISTGAPLELYYDAQGARGARFSTTWVISVASARNVRIRTTGLGVDNDPTDVKMKLLAHNLTAIYIPVRHGPVPP